MENLSSVAGAYREDTHRSIPQEPSRNDNLPQTPEE